jgi:hypothetical protein
VDFQTWFPWILAAPPLATLGFGCAAFGFILKGVDNHESRLFVVMATTIAHVFPACFSTRQLNDANIREDSLAFGVFFLNTAIPLTSMLVQLVPSMTTFLLVSVTDIL